MSDIRAVCESIKGKSGMGLVMHLKQALTNSKIFFYGQLLHTPEVQALKGTEHEKYFLLLENLAYHGYTDLKKLSKDVQDLVTPAMLFKIQQLSLIELAANKRRVTYAEISAVTGINEPRELEDLVIDTITEGLLRGRIDQLNSGIEIFEVAARNVQLSEIDKMIEKMAAWNQNCDNTIQQLQDSVMKTANHFQEVEDRAKAMAVEEENVMEEAKKKELEQHNAVMGEGEDGGGGGRGFPKRGRNNFGGGDFR